MSPRFPRLSARSIALSALCVGLAGAALAADPPLQPVSVRATAHFDFDDSGLRASDRDQLLAEVGRMQGVTWQRVVTVGHTDSVGDPGYNQRLAARRAQSVKAYLVGKGLDPAMIELQSQGETAPVADNTTDQGRAENRRAVVEFQGVRGTP